MKTKLLYFVTAIVLFQNTNAQIATQDGLIGWYEFANNTYTDIVNGNDFPSTITNAVPGREGFADQAIFTNGNVLGQNATDNLPIPSSANNKEITFDFWIRTTGYTTTRILINGKNTDFPDDFGEYPNVTTSTNTGFMLAVGAQGNLKAVLQNNFNNNIETAKASWNDPNINLFDNQWHRITVRFGMLQSPFGSTNLTEVELRASISVDGTASVTGLSFGNAYTTAELATINPVYGLGKFSVGGISIAQTNTTYEGDIDDLLIYDRYLFDGEVAALGGNKNLLTVTTPTNGNITQLPESTNGRYPNTMKVDVTAVPDFSFVFDNWSGDLTTSTITEQINMDSNKSIGANFVPRGNRLYVNPSATGNQNGITWANAHTDLQSALANATNQDEIWIAGGTYTPDATDRTIAFQFFWANMKIYGGFAGTETSITERIFGSNETILSGDLLNNDANSTSFGTNYSNGTRADNSYKIIDILQNGENLLLDGLTISDAHNYQPGINTVGGAIIKHKSIPFLTINNCIIKDNLNGVANAGLLAEFEINNFNSGFRGKLTVTNSIFSNNMSAFATGIYSVIRNNSEVDVEISNTLFDNNVSADRDASVTGITGSAAWFRNLGNGGSTVSIEINNCTFADNIDAGTEFDPSLRSPFTLGKTNGALSMDVEVNNSVFYGNVDASSVPNKPITDGIDSSASNSVVINNSSDQLNFNNLSTAYTVNNSVFINNTSPFNDSANGDYTLDMGVNLIDAGNNSFVSGSTDLANNQRIFNTAVDIGAYEFGSVSLSTNDFDLATKSVIVFPNPTSSILNIESQIALTQVEVFSILGKKVLSVNSKTIDVSKLNSGVYFLRLTTKNGSQSTLRFIKK